MQVIAPTEAKYVPEGHTEQVPPFDEKYPAGHGVQLSARKHEKPGEHVVTVHVPEQSEASS